VFRTLLVLLFLGACTFFVIGEKTAPAPEDTPRSSAPLIVDESVFQALKQALPSSIFEKDVQPVQEQNQKRGLSLEDLNKLTARLEQAEEALGSKTREAVDNALRALDPQAFPQKNAAERTMEAVGRLAGDAAQRLKEEMPAIKSLAEDFLQGLVMLISNALGAAAEILSR